MEQAPGPRGSPQVPQGPTDSLGADPPLADTAKTESCGASFLLWHLGHPGFSAPKTRASKRWLHPRQMYSKIGIAFPVGYFTRSLTPQARQYYAFQQRFH